MKPDDPLYIVVCNCIPACTSRNMHNQMPHTDCWDKFCKGITDDEILAEKLKKHRKPKMKDMTEEQKFFIDAFKQATYAKGFANFKNTNYGGVAAKRETSATIKYNVFSNIISYDDRCKRGLFDGFFINEINTNVYNEMHKIIDDGKCKNYNASKEIKKVFDEVDKI